MDIWVDVSWAGVVFEVNDVQGFSVVVEPQDHVGGTYILVKDVTWIAQ